MDGFHIYRKDLDEEGKKRRGAPFTFDLKQFKQKILQLKEIKSFPIKFPSFDHALKDPIQDEIIINYKIKCVIIEGLYIFDQSLELDSLNFWDLKIFIEEYR
jgi:pantothenate kinase